MTISHEFSTNFHRLECIEGKKLKRLMAEYGLPRTKARKLITYSQEKDKIMRKMIQRYGSHLEKLIGE